MAGLPLKSGADFYNLEAARLRLHNLGADPTEVGAGLIYFNTSTGLNTSQKARLYTGSAWKTIAFSEDLDVASNADFLALKDKVDTLIGDGVDMDGIIESWKEVEAFLSGMSDTKSLMDLLNGKLNTSGGTINGSLTLNEGALYFISGGKQYAYNVNTGNGEPIYLKNDAWQTLLHSGNYSDYALPLSGGTITSSKYDGLIIKRASDSAGALIAFENNGGRLGLFGFEGLDKVPIVYLGTDTNSYKYLLHSGNVGEYAITTKKWWEADDDIPLNTTGMWTNRGGYLSAGWSESYKMEFLTATDGIRVRAKHGNNDTDWKTIAFTDSDITGTAAKAKCLVDSAGNAVAYVSGNTFYIGDTIYPTTSTQILGKDIRLRYGANASFGFWLNESGNVTIGSQDLASSDYKLFVYGNSVFADTSRKGDINTTKISSSAIVEITAIAKGNDGLYIGQLANSTAWLQSAYGGSDTNPSSNHTYPLSLQPLGGNVLIGTTTDNGAKLQVAGIARFNAIEYTDCISNYDSQTGYFVGKRNAGLGVTTGGLLLLAYGATPISLHAGGFERMHITASGNVLIGTTNDNGAELQVAGSSTILGALSASTSFDLNRDGDNGNIFNSERAAFEIETLAKTVRFRTFNPDVNNVLTFYGSQGNVGIGKIAYTHKLEVEGNVHISGSLIVDGEVSAGGAGTEGGNAGGGGAFHSEGIAVGATQTTIAHGLGTDDIVVSIYEKDGVSGRWSFILTDVEIVDANNIIVSFGSATTVEHKVVIMGAVA